MFTYIIAFSNMILSSTILYISQVSMSWQKLMCLVMENHGEFACSFSYDVPRYRVASHSVPLQILPIALLSATQLSPAQLRKLMVVISQRCLVSLIDQAVTRSGTAYVLCHPHQEIIKIPDFDPLIYISTENNAYQSIYF